MMADEVCHRRRRQLTAIRGQERPWRSRRQGDSKRYYVISFCFASMLEYGSKDRLSGMPFVSLLVYDLYRLRHFNAFLVHLLKQEESSGFSLKLPINRDFPEEMGILGAKTGRMTSNLPEKIGSVKTAIFFRRAFFTCFSERLPVFVALSRVNEIAGQNFQEKNRKKTGKANGYMLHTAYRSIDRRAALVFSTATAAPLCYLK